MGVLFAVTGCVSGPVVDKRAPGYPGEKTFQIQVEDDRIVGDDKVWITVPEDIWERCGIDEQYEDCSG